MQKFEDNLTANTSGALRAIAGASVTVTDNATGLPASLYSDNGVTPLQQPLTTDRAGYFAFYAADGKYTLSFSGPRFGTFSRQLILEDPADNPYATLAQLGAASGSTLVNHEGTPLNVVLQNLASGGEGSAITSVNGVSPEAGDVSLTTDDLPESATPTNQWFTAARVRAVVLSGLSLASGATITAADTVLTALGRLQKQIMTWGEAKDASDGYAGLTGFAINIKNAAGTIVSKLVSAGTAVRTYTFPDKDGTVAMVSDLPSGLPITKYAQTAEQAITAGGGLTIAHGLGVVPKYIQAFLKCTTATLGYAVGDIFPYQVAASSSTSSGIAVTSDATNLYVRFGTTSLYVFNKDSGAATAVATGNFTLFIRVMA